MTMMLKILDQTPGIGTVEGPEISFEVCEVSAREIIRARVEAEVARHNSAEVSPGFVRWATPAGPERALNGARRERRRPLDVERQGEGAVEALRKSPVSLMFNGGQGEAIEAPLPRTPGTEARLLRPG